MSAEPERTRAEVAKARRLAEELAKTRPNSKMAIALDLIGQHVPALDWNARYQLLEAAAAASIPEHVLRRARQRLGLEYRQVAAFPSTDVQWRWPADEVAAAAAMPPPLPTCSCGPAELLDEDVCVKCGRRSVRAVRAVRPAND
jgi:hypothetical protein